MDLSQITVPQIIDIILLVVILISAIKSFRDGFLTAVIDFVGNIAGVIVSWILSNRWAPVVFEKMFREKIAEKTYKYIQNSTGKLDAGNLLQQYTGELPIPFMQDFVTKAEEMLGDVSVPAQQLAQNITDNVVGPIITVIIGIVIFAIGCGLCSFFAGILARTLKMVNEIPVVGFANRMGGFGVGILIGIVDIIIISCVLSIIAIITQNSLPVVNMDVLTQSRLLSLTSLINPFMG